MTKKEMFEEIRKRIEVDPSTNQFLTKTECVKIIGKIQGFDEKQSLALIGNTKAGEILPTWFNGWTEQVTVGTHPNLDNVKAIFKELTEIKELTFFYILKNINPKLGKRIKNMEFKEDKKLIIEFL